MAERLTVIIPCLNEERNIEATVDGIMEIVPSLPVEVSLMMVDDGSTDQTRTVMEGLCGRYEAVGMHVNPQNLGLGRSVLDAYERIDPDNWVTVIPGDNEFAFSSIRNFLAVREDHDIILGYLQNPVIRPMSRRLASDAFTKVVNLLYGFSYRYLNGMKMYRLRCFRGIEIRSSGHAFNAELLAKTVLRDPGIRIGEAAFVACGRAHGSTKAVRLGSIFQAVREVYLGYREVARYRSRIIQGGE